jgi:hypothetical protein
VFLRVVTSSEESIVFDCFFPHLSAGIGTWDVKNLPAVFYSIFFSKIFLRADTFIEFESIDTAVDGGLWAGGCCCFCF